MSKKILVVDNHPLVLKFMSSLLSKHGHEVLTAKDGLSALDILETYTPEVIFVDLIMPNISGDALCKVMRGKPELRNAYFVVLSAIAADEEVDFAGFGADACIAKASFEEMGAHVLAILEELESRVPRTTHRTTLRSEGVRPREITREILAVKRHFEVILESMSEGVVEITPDTRIVYANPRALDLIGISKEKLLGSSFKELFEGSDNDRVRELLGTNGSSPRRVSADFSLTIGDKLVAFKLLPIGGEGAGSLVILEDVSEKKRLEARLLQSQKMEAIGTLAGGIAHDFNNILGAIMGYTDLVLMGASLSGTNKEYLNKVLTASTRAKELVMQILLFSRKGERQERAALNIVPVVQEMVGLLRSSIPSTIEIRLEPMTEAAVIKANTNAIQQVIINLCTNAAHAMEQDGGILTIGVSDFHLGAAEAKCHRNLEPGPYVKIEVSDTGCGMDKPVLERIFDPYFTTKDVGKGTGLGLAVVHGVVEQHEGAIEVSSEPGKGSTFKILLPFSGDLPAEADGYSEQTESIPTGNERILVVDDEELLANVATDMLRSLGYETVFATSAQEALEIVRTEPYRFDLILTDFTMPHMTGKELAKAILKIRPEMPIILVTGYNQKISETTAREIGIREFMMKPLRVHDLGTAVRGALDDDRSLDFSEIL